MSLDQVSSLSWSLFVLWQWASACQCTPVQNTCLPSPSQWPSGLVWPIHYACALRWMLTFIIILNTIQGSKIWIRTWDTSIRLPDTSLGFYLSRFLPIISGMECAWVDVDLILMSALSQSPSPCVSFLGPSGPLVLALSVCMQLHSKTVNLWHF